MDARVGLADSLGAFLMKASELTFESFTSSTNNTTLPPRCIFVGFPAPPPGTPHKESLREIQTLFRSLLAMLTIFILMSFFAISCQDVVRTSPWVLLKGRD